MKMFFNIFIFFLFSLTCTFGESNDNSDSDIKCAPFSLSVPSFASDDAYEFENDNNNGENEHVHNNIRNIRKSERIIIGHRGASYHVPGNTLASYRLALEMGADYIESDLVVTKDGHLIAVLTVDLNVTTTNIVQYANSIGRSPWHSPYMNRTGYWTFNYTLDEIQTNLRVKQHEPGNGARAKEYDGLWTLPSLLEVQSLLHEWNYKRLPYLVRNNDDNTNNNENKDDTTNIGMNDSSTSSNTDDNITDYVSQKSGLYVEFKYADWIYADTGLNAITILLEMITQQSQSSGMFEDVIKCHPNKYHHYQIPPLVVASHDDFAIKEFHSQWKTKLPFKNLPIPPIVLIIDHKRCLQEDFWFQIGEEFRDTISGISPDKSCLLSSLEFDNNIGNLNTNPIEEKEVQTENEIFSKEFMVRAKEFNFVIFPWTERPEIEYVTGTDIINGKFNTMFDEMQYLFCTVGVDGILTESPSTTVLAGSLPCPETTDISANNAADEKGEKEDEKFEEFMVSEKSSSVLAQKITPNENSNEVDCSSYLAAIATSQQQKNDLYVGLVSFIVGVISTSVICLCYRIRTGGRRDQAVLVATTEDDANVVADREIA